MVKRKLVELKGRIFEYSERHYTKDELVTISQHTEKLKTCYTKPSSYNNWEKWYKELTNYYYCGNGSYNARIFSLIFIIDNVELFGNPIANYVVSITPCHNYIMRVI